MNIYNFPSVYNCGTSGGGNSLSYDSFENMYVSTTIDAVDIYAGSNSNWSFTGSLFNPSLNININTSSISKIILQQPVSGGKIAAALCSYDLDNNILTIKARSSILTMPPTSVFFEFDFLDSYEIRTTDLNYFIVLTESNGAKCRGILSTSNQNIRPLPSIFGANLGNLSGGLPTVQTQIIPSGEHNQRFYFMIQP